MSRTHKAILLVLATIALGALSGCGSENTAQVDEGAGFFNGLWDGLTVWFAFFGNLFGLGEWNIYEVHNTGGWYNFGFLLGVGCSTGGVSVGVSSAR